MKRRMHEVRCTGWPHRARERQPLHGPEDGTVQHVKLVSCWPESSGSSWPRPPESPRGQDRGNGPEITYHGQSPCGGASGDHYVVQSFRVILHVAKGDYIAIKADPPERCRARWRRLPPVRPAVACGWSAQKSHSGASATPVQLSTGRRQPPRCRTPTSRQLPQHRAADGLEVAMQIRLRIGVRSPK